MRVRRTGHLLLCGAVATLASVLLAVPAGAQATSAGTHTSTSPGTTVWSTQFSDQYGATATDVVANPRSPLVYVTGWTDTGQHEKGYGGQPLDDITTVAYDTTTGAQVWAENYQGGGYLGQGTPKIAVSPNGSQVFVGGAYCLGRPSCQVHDGEDGQVVLSYNAANGASLWAIYNESGTAPVAMTVTPDGYDVLLTGNAKFEGYVTTMITAQDGKVDWTVSSVLPPRNFYYEPPVAITVSPDDSTAFVTGTQGTVALSLDGGQMLWKRYAPGSVGPSLAVSQDSSVLVVAGCQPPVRNQRCSATKLTAYNAATGGYLWSLADDATSVVASPAGPQMFVATDMPGHDAITAYDIATGTRTQLWQAPSVGGQLALNRKATTVFAGVSSTRLSSESGTVAGYNASTGALSSTAPYTFAGYGQAMAISANGSKLFVTGTAPSAGPPSPGYLTTAYGL